MTKKKSGGSKSSSGGGGKKKATFVELAEKNVAKIEKIIDRYIKRLDGSEDGAGLFGAAEKVKAACGSMAEEIGLLSADFSPRKKFSRTIVFEVGMAVAIKKEQRGVYLSYKSADDLKDLRVQKIVGEGRGAKILVQIGDDETEVLGVVPKGHLQAA